MVTKERFPIKILHVVDSMNRGGVETWLMQVFRRIDLNIFRIDLLVHTIAACEYNNELQSLGIRIIPCLRPDRPWQYALNFKNIIKKYGPYDIIHSHVNRFSGFVMFLAYLAKIPMRIVRSSSTSDGRSANYQRRLYNKLMLYLTKRYATHLQATTQAAALGLFESRLSNTNYSRILNTGIDFQVFKNLQDKQIIRNALKIPVNVPVIGHVGRFVEAKNHDFIINLADRILQERPEMHFLCIGDGPLRPQIEKKVSVLKIKGNFTFTGVRPDIPDLLFAMDVFLFPSKWEGFGRVILEAHAAGVPCIISDVIPPDIDVVAPLIKRLSLSKPISQWCREILNFIETPAMITREESLNILENSRFDINYSVRELVSIYINR
ncbi:glycosyltransferase [Desulfobacca acetoxidans]|uniref:Glycosyl transferase group 1 n=1 Tax=Desulfobacca acetoxidans (strain ATCC 700848 / DSM 11109 / ASRB2) TaxID=880072 RepID=F2NED7_DESAR|nr:glycosyltransferase [Desulfobacca acetoxidans]AEB08127.1 glycosyl transferase group 1 [Desulfobacca acetoxidans DSM 11109]